MGSERVPNLPAYVQTIDFIGAQINDGQDGAMGKQKRAWQDHVSMEIVRDCYVEFEKKVAIKGFPPAKTDSANLAAYILTHLSSLLKHAVEKGGGVANDTEEKMAQRQLEAGHIKLHAWTAMLNAGPRSTHLILMGDMFDRHVKEFFQSLDRQQIVSILSSLKREFVSDTSEEKEYASKLRCGIDVVLENYTRRQKDAVHLEMLDLYMYHLVHLQKAPQNIAKTIQTLCRVMMDKYDDDNIFLGIMSVDVMKKSLETLKQLVLSDHYHAKGSNTHELITKTFKSCVRAVHAKQDGVILLDEMFDFVMAVMLEVCKNEKCSNSKDAMEIWRYILFILNKTKPTDATFQSCISTLIEIMAGVVPMTPHVEEVIERGYINFLRHCLKPTPDQAKIRLQWCLAALKTGRNSLADCVECMLSDERNKKVFQWKNCMEEAKQMLELIGSMRREDFQDENKQKRASTISQYAKVLKTLLSQIKLARALPQITASIVECGLKCLEIDPASKTKIASDITNSDFMDLQKHQKLIPDILRRVLKLLQKYPWDSDAQWATSHFIRYSITAFSNGRQVSVECNQLFVDIFLKCMEGEDEDRFFQAEHPDRTNIYFRLLSYLNDYIELQSTTKDVIIPLVPGLLKWCKIAADNDQLMPVFMSSLQCLGQGSPKGLKDSLPQILDICLVQESYHNLYGLIRKLYQVNPGPLHARIPDLFEKYPTSSESDRNMILTFLHEVSQKHPEVFTQEQIGAMLEDCKEDPGEGPSLTLAIIQSVAGKVPKRLAPFFDLITDDSVFQTETLNVRGSIVACIGSVNQTLCQRAVDYLMKHTEDKNSTISLIVVTTLRTMVQGNLKHFEKHKAQLAKVEKSTKNPITAESCHSMILAIEGKHVEGLFDDLKEQQEDIDNLDERVTGAEGEINVLGVKVDDQGREIKDVKKDVVKVEKRVDEVEEDLGETKIKVEEIDNKTMTNAPKWSRDLTKLMNPVAENDWRLLAKRLGYSNNDIRGWATQHDPCMALLSEWYAVRKTSEASRAVYTALEEMDRMDGLAIVENAMKAAEGVVEDEEFEYASPPPIFLSYQWGMQEEVKLLHKHLNMAGYQCWMDIGQMGGGDKLFAKIDNGIRAAKLVICCTTEKYAKSPNCNREVNLSVSLGKPIIPLLMEKMDWPPKGSMGPIFSEYLFIRFFQRGGEETKDQRYWPVPKFQELLMQLNFNKVMPEEGKISKAYKNWWVPVEDIIIIDKNKKKQGTSTAPAEKKKEGGEESSPDVFLSYQWGKQPQLKELYKRLTGMGYTCWMDIYQMGGGDSLYDKIDRGLRGCKVVVTCVTPKYALSANCRREVSLADALKKPIVPLLLDQMTWPPDGPMSMVFTQLLYINFYRNQDDQMQWKSPQFQEMVDQISQHLPAIESGKSDDSAQKNNPTATPEKKPNASENKPKGPENKPRAAPENKARGPENKPSSSDNRPKASPGMKSAGSAASTAKTQEKTGGDKSQPENKTEGTPKSKAKERPGSKQESKDDEQTTPPETSAARQSFMVQRRQAAQASYPSKQTQDKNKPTTTDVKSTSKTDSEERRLSQSSRTSANQDPAIGRSAKNGTEDTHLVKIADNKSQPVTVNESTIRTEPASKQREEQANGSNGSKGQMKAAAKQVSKEDKTDSKGKEENPATKSKSCLIL